MTWTVLFQIVVFLAAGAAIGAAYFSLLRLAVGRFAAAKGSFSLIPLTVARLALAVAAFAAIAQAGAVALIAALGGFLLVRKVFEHQSNWS